MFFKDTHDFFSVDCFAISIFFNVFLKQNPLIIFLNILLLIEEFFSKHFKILNQGYYSLQSTIVLPKIGLSIGF